MPTHRNGAGKGQDTKPCSQPCRVANTSVPSVPTNLVRHPPTKQHPPGTKTYRRCRYMKLGYEAHWY